VAAIVLTALFVPESRAASARRPDAVGQVLVVTVLAAVTYAIVEGSHRGYGSPPIVGLLVLAAAAATALVAYERRREQPLIDPEFFRSIPFTGAAVTAVAAFVALSGFLFLNTLYLQDVRGYSALHAGLLTAPMAVATAIASPVSGRLTANRGPRPPLVAAGLLIALAALMLTRVTGATPPLALLPAYVLFGIGFGLVNTPITTTAVAGMPRAQAGVSAAVASTGRQIGNCLGVAVLGSLVAAHGAAGDAAGDAFTAAAGRPGWWILAGCGAAVAVLGVLTTTDRATASAARTAARFQAAPAATAPSPGPVRLG
jgi:MFS family permease